MKAMKTGRGKMHPASAMFFRVSAGEASHEETGESYELSTSAHDRAPIIHSRQTGKWWTMSWQGLVDLAVNEGIDEA